MNNATANVLPMAEEVVCLSLDKLASNDDKARKDVIGNMEATANPSAFTL